MSVSARWSANGNERDDPGVIAFYYPQFHAIDLNDEQYEPGFTEWTIVDRARPLFDGHRQPRVPGELGRYDLTTPGVWEAQVALAERAGLGGFCFYHYWFEPGRRLLERPLEIALASDTTLPLCLMWANHDWTRVWEGDASTITMSMSYAPGNGAAFVAESAHVFRDARYLRVDGRPLLLIYDLDGPPDLDALVAEIRAGAAAAGIGDLFIAGMQRGRLTDRIRSSALDGMCEFPPTGYHDDRFLLAEPPTDLSTDFDGRILDYGRVMTASLAGALLDPEVSWFQTAVPDWDNTGRRMVSTDPWLFPNATPDHFEKWMTGLLARSRDDERLPLVFVNAWNEWGEGAYLEPDATNGAALLGAVSRAIERVADGESVPQPVSGLPASLEPPDRVVIELTDESETVTPSHEATLWVEQVGFSEPPFTQAPSLSGRWQRIRGFLVSPELTNSNAAIELLLIGDETYRAVVPGRDRADVLVKHGSWLTTDNVAGAGFDLWLNVGALAAGSYRLVVRRDVWANELSQPIELGGQAEG